VKTAITLTLTFIMVLTAAGCAGGTERGEADVLDIRELARDFWELENGGVRKRESPRFAVVEFTVEYVDESTGAEPKVKGVQFSSSMKLESPGILYRSFMQALENIKRHPVDLERVAGSDTYRTLKGTALDDIAIALVAGKDPGADRYPVEGLLALDDSQKDLDEKIRKTAREVGADVSLQVRLRVGVLGGRAAILKGSVLRVVAPEGTAKFVSRLTLLAPTLVVVNLGEGAPRAIDTGKYLDSLKRLFVPYVNMALIATES